jgi:hypothetical protein
MQTSIVDFTHVIAWYQSHCDGEWEHKYGIKLETLDNPGWQLTVDLIHTELQGRPMEEVIEGCRPDGHPVSPRWIHCVVRQNQFRGACDPTQISRLFSTFNRFNASIDGA